MLTVVFYHLHINNRLLQSFAFSWCSSSETAASWLRLGILLTLFTFPSDPRRVWEFQDQYVPPRKLCTSPPPYVIAEICCIASSTRFLFLSASHNAPLRLLDDVPNNSSGRGCHGYGNRSDAPHLSLVTEFACFPCIWMGFVQVLKVPKLVL